MNPRIKQLAKQAGFQYDPVKEIWYLEGLNPSCDQEFEKLSELIVQECAMIATRTFCPYEDEVAKQTHGHTWDMACIESAKDIRKHFGLE